MPAIEEPALSLAEWLVLCLVCEKPQHGFAIARLLGANGELGRIWRVPKPVVYRSLQRLEDAGLLQSTEPEPSTMGPVREPVRATAKGRKQAAGWLTKPAGHARDVRSELLVKLALLDRAGTDPRPLIEAQREQLIPVAQALEARLASSSGFDRTLVLWRSETISATLRFLDAMRSDTQDRAKRSALAARSRRPA